MRAGATGLRGGPVLYMPIALRVSIRADGLDHIDKSSRQAAPGEARPFMGSS